MSENKDMSHSLLRGLLLSKTNVFKDMKKADILSLCRAYNVKVPSRTKKSGIVDVLLKAVVNCSDMSNPRALIEKESGSRPDTAVADAADTEPGPTSTDTTVDNIADTEPGPTFIETTEADAEPSTSAMHSSPEPMDTEEDEDSDLCKKCNKTGKEGVQWIQCNSCSGWLHRNCAGLRAKKAWVKFSGTGADFFCSECK